MNDLTATLQHLKAEIHERLAELKTERDELRVRLHLAKAEVQQEWDKAEAQWAQFQVKSEALGKCVWVRHDETWRLQHARWGMTFTALIRKSGMRCRGKGTIAFSAVRSRMRYSGTRPICQRSGTKQLTAIEFAAGCGRSRKNG